MYLHNWLETLQLYLGEDLLRFAPELVLCFAIVLMLLLKLFKGFHRVHLGSLALGLTLVALGLNWEQWDPAFLAKIAGLFGVGWEQVEEGKKASVMFTGMLAYDYFTLFLRLFLLGFTVLVIWLSMLTGIPDQEDSADFYALLLGAVVGMSLMASANHLLMVFIGVEMASLPSYALAGFLKGKRQSSEAALKYVVYGGGATGVMLYGISLLAGQFGTAYLPDLAYAYAGALHQDSAAGVAGVDPYLVLGTLFILI